MVTCWEEAARATFETTTLYELAAAALVAAAVKRVVSPEVAVGDPA